MSPDKISIFSIEIDAVNMRQAVDKIHGWLDADARDCRYVVTPNVNHIVKLSKSLPFKQAYEAASLTLADGRPIVLASVLLGNPLPGTVPGSDLVPALFDSFGNQKEKQLSVYLLGAGAGVADNAKKIIEQRWRNVVVTGTYSPPLGFEKDQSECDSIIAKITASNADLLILGLGAPKQELWVHQYAHVLPVKAALCVGATIDFLAGDKPRAPVWMRRVGLEWLHRVITEPRRLASRYAYDAIIFPCLFLGEAKKKYLSQ